MNPSSPVPSFPDAKAAVAEAADRAHEVQLYKADNRVLRAENAALKAEAEKAAADAKVLLQEQERRTAEQERRNAALSLANRSMWGVSICSCLMKL